ncbi:MAG: radical SAM protein [Desulfobulbaceae bacterium]|nr:radical SAM protein [Desulfobulbaceae bacterium]
MAVRNHPHPPLRRELLAAERGGIHKKWTGKLPVALIYPSDYAVGMANLGMQLIYHLLNQDAALVAERFFVDARSAAPPRSLESGRPLTDFPLIMACLSFEQDLPALVALLVAAGVEPLAAKRPEEISAEAPLLIVGGVALSVNPEIVAPFADLLVIGEAEAISAELLAALRNMWEHPPRRRLEFLTAVARALPGCYPPTLYEVVYEHGRYLRHQALAEGLPARIRRAFPEALTSAGFSRLLTPNCEFSDLFLTEMGRGCSRACRFCAAGFVYRPPRRWTTAAVLAALSERPQGIGRVGLLGMEMTAPETLEAVTTALSDQHCALSFSSLRADALNDSLLTLLARSDLKSVAIAPDGCSERLRRVINKGLAEHDLLSAAERLVAAGIVRLKLYWMVGLPTETDADILEAACLIGKIKARIDPLGRARGRVCQLVLSVNCFVPKPWTPFQYHIFGDSPDPKEAVAELRRRLRLFRQAVRECANTSFHHDKPENTLWQAVLAKGDRRLAPAILDMAMRGRPWTQALKNHDLTTADFTSQGSRADTPLPWMILDHGLNDEYLRRDYERALAEKTTAPCQPATCRRCGVCHD